MIYVRRPTRAKSLNGMDQRSMPTGLSRLHLEVLTSSSQHCKQTPRNILGNIRVYNGVK